MGYTHYFSFRTPRREKGEAEKIEKNYQRAIKQCQKIIQTYSKVNGGIAGFTAHSKLMQYGGVFVNGRAGEDCEDFILREHFAQNRNDVYGGLFCKTNRQPYDILVVACLIILKHYLGKNFAVSSDGDQIDFGLGLLLAKKITGLKTLKTPESIRSARIRSIS